MTDKIKLLFKSDEYSDEYEDDNFIDSMGSMLVIGIIMALIALLIIILAWSLNKSKKCGCCTKVLTQLK